MASQSLFAIIFRGASLALFARLVFTAAGFAITSITALWYGAEVVGVVATLTTVTTLLGLLANAGTSTSINTYITSPLAAGAPHAARRAYRKILSICLIGSGLCAAALVLAGSGWAERSLSGVAGMPPALLLVLAALSVPMRVVSEITTLAMRTLNHIFGFAALIILPALANLLVLGLGILLGQGPAAAVWGFFAGLGVAALLGLIWVGRRFDLAPTESAPASEPGMLSMLHHSFPMLISTIGAYVVTSSGLLILSYFATDAETGHFSVALRMATVTSLVLMSINSITTPIFAQLHAAGDTEQLVSVARRTSRLMFWATVPLIVTLVLFGRPLLSFAFGPEFESAYVPMLVILAGQLVNTVTGPSDFLMNMAGMQRNLRNIIAPAALIAVVIGVALVPFWGGIGAALAYGIALSGWNISSAIVLRRRFGLWIGYVPVLSGR